MVKVESMKKITVVGSINMDYVLNVPHMPQTGETLLAQNFAMLPGGKGANQAYAAGKLEGAVTMLGAVGDDGAGRVLCESLRSAGVDVSRIQPVKEEATGSAFICVDPAGSNHIVVAQGANRAMDIAYLQENDDVLKASDIVVLQLEIPLETVLYAAKRAKELGKLVILDPAPARSDIPDDLYPCIDYLKPNEGEAALLAGVPEGDPVKAANLLRAKGVKNVLVTLGAEGALLLDETGAVKKFPGLTGLTVVDTTAAGDCFTAALACRLAAEESPEQAVSFAGKASGLSVTRAGAQPSLPTLREVLDWKG